jgi:hypothetical protein
VPPLAAHVTLGGGPVGTLRLTPHGLRLEPAASDDPDQDNRARLEALVADLNRPHWSDGRFLRALPAYFGGDVRVELEEG